jgi:hypothetical protein
MVSGMLLIQCSPVSSGATLPKVTAVPYLGHRLQAMTATMIRAKKVANRNIASSCFSSAHLKARAVLRHNQLDGWHHDLVAISAQNGKT